MLSLYYMGGQTAACEPHTALLAESVARKEFKKILSRLTYQQKHKIAT